MGSCQKYGPFLGTLNIRCRTKLGTAKGTIILTTTHMYGEAPSRPLASEHVWEFPKIGDANIVPK